jgi:undecaprenyl phosphate N,N'-diacetylbacillosamine 1-phosphate transferase
LLWLVPGMWSCGGWIFRQQRVGKGEQIFTINKFQTMRKDKYIPRLAKWMRMTSLDELPQVINILKGEMSFIGPRPLLPEYLPRYEEWQRQRHDVLPGITGWAQVNGRNVQTWEDRLALDVTYAKAPSWKRDFKIILATFITLLKYRENSEEMSEFQGTKSK